MQRRDFLKLSAAVGATSCITACGSEKSQILSPPEAEVAEKINWYGCTVNCYATCPIKAVTQDGVLVRIESDDMEADTDEMPQHRACLRGRSGKQKANCADRLTQPMKRVGPRGSGEFVEISWDEAITEIYGNMKATIEKYGNESLYVPVGSGKIMSGMNGLSPAPWLNNLLSLVGGYLGHYYSYSYAGLEEACLRTYGVERFSGSNLSIARDSDLIVGFGFNPNETQMSGAGQSYEWTKLAESKEIILIDPRYTDSTLGKESQWIPIVPGTDAALVEALSYEIITNDKADEAFLNTLCVGYDSTTLPASAAPNSDYKSHILGYGPDGVVKTPEYAEEITGIPADTIRELAVKLWSAKAPFITSGYAPQRHANGENTARALMMLPLLLGQVGKPGTNDSTAPNAFYGSPFAMGIPWLPNPVSTQISFYMWPQACLEGDKMTDKNAGLRGGDKLEQNIKFIWASASNCLINQHGDSNKCAEILRDESLVEFIVVHDVRMTPSAKFADILLPDLMDLEERDMTISTRSQNSVFVPATSSIESHVNGKNCFNVCLELAKRFGVEEEYAQGKSYEEWCEHVFHATRGYFVSINSDADNLIPKTYDEFCAGGPVTIPTNLASVILEDYVSSGGANKLPTPTGKIEIYSETIQTYADEWELPEGDEISAIPKFISTREGPLDTETRKDYPLQAYGIHTKGGVHSSFNYPWLYEAVSNVIWINPEDAEKYNVNDGKMALVSSKRGTIKIKVRVTPRVIPGVMIMRQGNYYNDVNGIDEGACANTLTSGVPTPLGKCNPQHTILVNIKPA
ncbi:DMSO/selenate family reductase complex A subunit [Shewanella sp. A14]